MTRETKIGLLVGLAFMIVIGLLLSDHLTHQNDPTPAPLNQAMNHLMVGLRTPGGNPVPAQPPSPPTVVAPVQPVPITGDLMPRTAPVQQINIGPSLAAGGAGTYSAINYGDYSAGSAGTYGTGADGSIMIGPGGAPQYGPVAAGGTGEAYVHEPVRSATPVGQSAMQGPNHLVALAQAMGEEVVPVGAGRQAPTQTQVRTAPVREYVAVSGDNLSRLASRMPGGNTKANREAIIRLNPSLQTNPNKIIAGQTYLIPATAEVATTSSGPAAVSGQPATSGQSSSVRPVATGNERWYTVRKGDNLTHIARDQLGDTSLVPVIKELNKETLRGSDMIREGQKLRLPARPNGSMG